MLKKFIYILFLIIITSIFGEIPSYGFDSEKIIRVGISDTSFSKYIFERISLYSSSKMEIVDIATGNAIKTEGKNISFIMKDDLFNVVIDSQTVMKDLNGPVAVSTIPNSLIGIGGVTRAGKPAY